MKVFRPLSVFLVFCCLSACVTTYQPAGTDSTGRGYWESRLKTDLWRVYFQGGSDAPPHYVEGALLYRCAEVVLAAGFDHFLLLESNTSARRSTFTYGQGTYTGTATETATGYNVRGRYVPPRSVSTQHFVGEALIVGVRGPTPRTDPGAFDARETLQILRPMVIGNR